MHPRLFFFFVTYTLPSYAYNEEFSIALGNKKIHIIRYISLYQVKFVHHAI